MEYLELLEDGKFQAIKLSNTSCSDALGKENIPYFPIGTVVFFPKGKIFFGKEKDFFQWEKYYLSSNIRNTFFGNDKSSF